MIWVIVILALAWSMGLLSYILDMDHQDNRVYPLSAEDQALWEHYRQRDRDKIRQLRMDRYSQTRLWNEVGYPMAVWEYRAKYIKSRKVA